MKTLRCAIYTRKSAEEGLDQAFNSLDAQREACEAYIKSQAGEGWSQVKTRYDDGGFSGGTLERPALQALLKAIDAGLVDVVVVYKVDRLTRALADFAKIVDRFDAKAVSFVSVTQAFNTTTSMGRLTLNVLLSFAQFEREVTGERIRDKVAASKAKGMWMGGNLPLGYDRPTDLATRALVVNEAEAATVRLIFAKYLDLQSVHALRRWLDDHGIISKQWTSTRGKLMGGQPFSRGALFHLLKNRIYLGQIVHRGALHPGAHPGIVDEAVFEAVQTSLQDRSMRHHQRPTRVASALLKGLVFDSAGEPMSPTFSQGRGGRLHRYYVSAALQQGRKPKASDDHIRRVPAEALEALAHQIASKLGAGALREALVRLELHPASVQMLWRPDRLPGGSGDPQAQLQMLASKLAHGERLTLPADGGPIRLILPCRFQMRGGRTWTLASDGRPLRIREAEVDDTLVKGLRAAHVLLNSHGRPSPRGQPVLQAMPKSWYERLLVRLVFLAPDIQRAILEGRQPPTLMLEDLVRGAIAVSWAEQRRRFGFPAAL